MRRFFACMFLAVLFSSHASASLVNDVNALRAKGCREHPGVKTQLKPSRELDVVASEWSQGGRLRDALTRAQYQAVNSASMHIEGAPTNEALMSALLSNYCEQLTNPAFTTIGISQKSKDVYIVVAQPFAAPGVRDAQKIAEQVLALVNKARAQPRKCGSKSFVAAPPVALSAVLNRAALIHAQDMAQHNFFEHEGSDGSTPADRATRVGYQWRNIAENIAAGPTTAETVVQGWIDSPGPCANIMDPAYAEMGIAYATNPKSQAWIYWSQEFGRSRK
ncbi:MAG: CAP domain-containing protein [Povalibacter sp.]